MNIPLLCLYSFFFKYLFIWLRRVVVAAHGIFIAASFVVACGLLSSCGVQALECTGLSCPMACGILFPRPGVNPASPALEGGFLTTGPPGKSCLCSFFVCLFF